MLCNILKIKIKIFFKIFYSLHPYLTFSKMVKFRICTVLHSNKPNFLIDSEMICYIFCGSLYKFCEQCKDILRGSWEKEIQNLTITQFWSCLVLGEELDTFLA